MLNKVALANGDLKEIDSEIADNEKFGILLSKHINLKF
jgi:hypothetical protein